MDLTMTMEFKSGVTISITQYEEEKTVKISFGYEEWYLTIDEFYIFITMLEKIKPIKQ